MFYFHTLDKQFYISHIPNFKPYNQQIYGEHFQRNKKGHSHRGRDYG